MRQASHFWRSLSSRERRTLFIGATTIAMVMLGVRGVPAWLTFSDEVRRSAEELELEVARARSSIASYEGSQSALERLEERRRTLAALLLEAGESSGAAASLGALMSSAARRTGLGIESMRIDVDTAVAAPSRVRASIEGSGDVVSLSRFLHAVEGGALGLRVLGLTITASDVHGEHEAPEHLRIRVTVEAMAGGKGREEAPDA